MIWHQPREYVLEQEMTRIWEVIIIQYRKAHPKENIPIRNDNETMDSMDTSRAESIRAQKKIRERIQKEKEGNG